MKLFEKFVLYTAILFGTAMVVSQVVIAGHHREIMQIALR